MIQRQGIQGGVKHISLRILRLQDLCHSGILSITAVQTRYNLADFGTKSSPASRLRFLLSLFRFFTGNPDSHEAVGLQEQADQLDIEALQVLRALCRDSEFPRHDRSVLRSLVDSVRGSNSSNRNFNNDNPTRNYNIVNNCRSCMFALLVSSFLTGSTATSPTTTMEQGPADPFSGIRSWLLQLLSHLSVVLFTFAVWWCNTRREKEEEKVEKKCPKGKRTTKKRKYRRNRSFGTTSSQEATQDEEKDEEQEEERKKSKASRRKGRKIKSQAAHKKDQESLKGQEKVKRRSKRQRN